MSASACPQCGSQVMTFGQFLLKAEPHKTYCCPNCGVELTRGASVWIAVLLMGLFAGAIIGFIASKEVHPGWLIGAGIACVVIGTLLVKVVNFNLIRWRTKEPVS